MEELKSGPTERATMPSLFYGMAALLVFMMVYLQYLIKSPKKTNTKPTVKILGEAKIGGDWTALDSSGKSVTNKEFLGNYIVFYFGFTRCPDICPASLQKLASAIDMLKGKKVKDIQYLFISLDVGRDTPEIVKKYGKVFHDDIQSFVVKEHDLTDFLKTFKLYSRKVLNENDYMLDHTSYMYLFDKNGKFVNVLGANLNSEELAQIIYDHIQEIENP